MQCPTGRPHDRWDSPRSVPATPPDRVSDGRTLCVSDFNRGGIFRGVDGGVTRERRSTGDPPSDRVWALGLVPEAPARSLGATPAGLHLLGSGSVAGPEPALP